MHSASPWLFFTVKPDTFRSPQPFSPPGLHCWRSSKMTDIDALCQLDMLDNEWTSSSVLPEDWHQVRMAQRTSKSKLWPRQQTPGIQRYHGRSSWSSAPPASLPVPPHPREGEATHDRLQLPTVETSLSWHDSGTDETHRNDLTIKWLVRYSCHQPTGCFYHATSNFIKLHLSTITTLFF